MVRPDLPSPANAVGSFEAHLDKARNLRRVSTLLGEKNNLGQTHADLPKWFTRTGTISFEIDSGFGTVLCCAPDHRTQKRMEAADEAVSLARERRTEDPTREAEIAKVEAARDDMRTAFALKMIRSLPAGWKNEREEVKEGALNVAPGGVLPAPQTVAALGLAEQRAYMTLLPPSLLGQVWAGYGLLSIPPLYYDETRHPDPS